MKFAFSYNGHKLVFGDSDLALDTDNEKFKFFSHTEREAEEKQEDKQEWGKKRLRMLLPHNFSMNSYAIFTLNNI